MNTQPVIYLHVGHGKTGSSFLQASLALSTQKLAEQNILYPYHRSFEAAKKGKITSGNMDRSNDLLPFVSQVVEEQSGFGTYVFSNEALFHRMNEDDLSRLASEYQVRVVLFGRDPLEYVVSMYGQAVKRGGFAGGFSEFVETHPASGNMSARVLSFIKDAKAADCDIAFVNYSRSKDKVLQKFETAIGCQPNTLVVPPVKVVNRSMSRAELYFLRHVNKYLDRWGGRLISDPLCNRLPEVASERPFMSSSFLDRFFKKQRPVLEELNTLIPEEEAFDVSFPSDWKSEEEDEVSFSYSKAQIEIIAESLAGQIAKDTPINVEEGDQLRRIARKMRGGESFSDAEADLVLRVVDALEPK